MASRSKTLRLAHAWSQRQMADYLGVHPATVSRLEDRKPGDEPGSIKRLLDLLEADPKLMTTSPTEGVARPAPSESPPTAPAEPEAPAAEVPA